MFCNKCGKEVPDGVAFCPGCGQKLGEGAPETPTTGGGSIKESSVESGQLAGSSPEMSYRSVGIRFAALLVDGVLFFVIFFVLGRIMAGSMGRVDAEGWKLSGGPGFLFMCIMSVIMLLYYTLLEGSIGASLGKLVCRIRVVSEDGSKCSYGQAFTRNILRVVDGLFVYLVGAIIVWKSPKRQRLGDKVARTVVVKK